MSKEPYKFYEMKCPYCDDIITELLEQRLDTTPFRCPSCKHILSLYGTFGYNMWLSANKKAKKCKERPIDNKWINDLINKDNEKQKEQTVNYSCENEENSEEMFIENDEEPINKHVENIEIISNKIKNLLKSMGYENVNIQPVDLQFKNELKSSIDSDKEFKEYVNSITEQTQEIAIVSLAQHNSFMKIGFTHEESMNLLNNLIKSNSLFPKLND